MSPPNQTSAVRSDTRLHLMRLRQERLAKKRDQRLPTTLDPIVSAEASDNPVLHETNEGIDPPVCEDAGAIVSSDLDFTPSAPPEAEEDADALVDANETSGASPSPDLVEETQPDVENCLGPEADQVATGSLEAPEPEPATVLEAPSGIDFDAAQASELQEDAAPQEDTVDQPAGLAEEAVSVNDPEQIGSEPAPADQAPETVPLDVTSSTDLTALPGSGPGLIWMLETCGITSMEQLAAADAEKLKDDMGLVAKIIDVDYWIDFARAEGTAT